jgi:hypothetical protein
VKVEEGGVRIWLSESLIERPIPERRSGFEADGSYRKGFQSGTSVKTQKAGRASLDKVPSFKFPKTKVCGMQKDHFI